MKRNSKLAVALHAMGHLALENGRPVTSEELAAHSGTHPVVLRRVLGRLRTAGLVVSAKGHAGGWRLARPAVKTTLAEIYAALGELLLTPAGDGDELPPTCAIERSMHGIVDSALAAAEATLLAELRDRTLAEVAAVIAVSGTAPPQTPEG